MFGNNAEGMIQIVKKADCELANTHLDKATIATKHYSKWHDSRQLKFECQL